MTVEPMKDGSMRIRPYRTNTGRDIPYVDRSTAAIEWHLPDTTADPTSVSNMMAGRAVIYSRPQYNLEIDESLCED